MSNYTIPQETFCKYCIKTFNVNRGTCEGSHCEEAKEDFLEEHEIYEIEYEPVSIQNLRPGNKVYVISDDKIQILTVNRITYDIKTLLIDTGIHNFYIDTDKINESSYYEKEKGFFIKKEEAIKKYKELISEKNSKMMDIIIKLETE